MTETTAFHTNSDAIRIRGTIFCAALLSASVAAGYVSNEFCWTRRGALGLAALTPLLWLEAESRPASFLVPFVFHAVFSREIPSEYLSLPGRFFVSFLLSALYCLLWLPQKQIRPAFKSGSKRILHTFSALIVSVPPPLGLAGWANPLTASGLFFPAWGWWGLAAMFFLYAAASISAICRRCVMLLMISVVLFADIPGETPKSVTLEGGITVQALDMECGTKGRY